MGNRNRLGYCGLFCGACELFIATHKKSLDRLPNESEIPLRLLQCKGCRSDIVSIYCRNCSIRKCGIEKDIEVCVECNEFPCSVLKAFENDHCPHHKGLINSQKGIIETGIDGYIKKQQERWRCKDCNRAFSWYETRCRSCGATVSGYSE